jgi:NAD(P)-dependent dehydrogenase (short-subunit alcohol dehydrogenase family)
MVISLVPSKLAIFIRRDVRRSDSVEHLFSRTREEFACLDVLFNNAGVTAPPIPIEALTFAQWSEVVKVHLTGAFLCAQEAHDESVTAARRTHHQQRIDFGPCAQTQFGAIHSHKARDHRTD